MQVHHYDDMIKRGGEQPLEVTPPQPHHCAVLMYTSGSTGKPKGIVCLHQHLVSLLGALAVQVGVGEGERLVGYLPLAHIFEMQMEYFSFGWGGTIGYADPKSLTGGTGKCMMQTPAGDLEPRGALEEYGPTALGAVPKVWEVIMSGAKAKVAAGGADKEFLFDLALWWKKMAMPQWRYTPLFDLLVFRKFKKTLGGRLRLAVSGGGAIGEEVQAWVRTVFGCPLVQGYGLTETCAGLTVQMPDDFRVGIAGSPLPTCDVLVASCPDLCDNDGMPYMADDTRHGAVTVRGRGEVWVRGNNVTRGYYKMPEATADAWTMDGWFRTGDVAVMLPDGSLRIVDRKKSIVKLKAGEYVALDKMNNALKTADIVNKDNGGVCVVADDSLDRPICLVQVDEAQLTALAKKLSASATRRPPSLQPVHTSDGADAVTDIPSMCRSRTLRDAVKQQLLTAGKRQGLTSPLEQIAAVALLHDEQAWTPENGCMTATQKLVPRKIKAVCAAEIKALKAGR